MPSLLAVASSAEPMAVDDSASKKAKRNLEAASSRKEKKEKKRKAREPPPPAASSSDEDRSSTSSEEPAASAPAAKKAKKESDKRKGKAVADEEDDDGELTASGDEDPADPNALCNFRISEALRQSLKSKGIKALFPIQATTFDLVLDGNDLVGRARTGQGKTLAFVLPILESLVNGTHKTSRRTDHGRPPSVLVLLPTRELAKQVHTEFAFYGATFGLSSCCVYGGSDYRHQEVSIRRGVDIIVGTPGRVKDFIVKGTLNLKSLKFRVLDEADEMLNMGFVDDVELILGKVEDVTKVQTLLFSATIPAWVKKLSLKFLKDNKKTVDLVGDKKLKASASVKHLALSCSSVARAQIISDITRCYSHGGRTIIFTETKESATELSGLIAGSRALHGDVVQAQREVILVGFGSGKFLVLVATNVAVLGLDIDDVQLITQCEPPRDVEAYIHWLGRTGRAGNTGVAVVLLKLRYKHNVSRIERESGVKFEHISAPLPTDLAQSAGTEVAEAIANLSSQYFELLVKLKNDQEHLFRNMPRNEYHNLFNFMIGKYLKILNLEMGTKDMDFVQLLVSLQNSRFSNRWIWSGRGKNWCVAERLGKMYPGGIDRFKKAQTMEPFSVHSGLDAKNAPVVVRTGKSPLAPWTLPQNSHFGPSQNNQISGHVGTQVGSGQSTWQPPDWVIEPHPGVYYLDVLKDGEVIDRINLDMKRHIFGRQVPVLRFCVGPSVCVMPACCHHSTQKWKHLCYGFRISSRHVCGK